MMDLFGLARMTVAEWPAREQHQLSDSTRPGPGNEVIVKMYQIDCRSKSQIHQAVGALYCLTDANIGLV